MDLEGYRQAARRHLAGLPPEERCRPASASALYDAMALVGARTLPHLLALYGLSDLARVPGSKSAVGGAIRCQLTAWLFDRPCETWLGLDSASVNTVCWFITHAPEDVLRAAVREAHRSRPVPAHRLDAWLRFVAQAPVHPEAQS